MKPQLVGNQSNEIIKASEKHGIHERDEACLTHDLSRAAFERGFMSEKMLQNIRAHRDRDVQSYTTNGDGSREQQNQNSNESNGAGPHEGIIGRDWPHTTSDNNTSTGQLSPNISNGTGLSQTSETCGKAN